MKKLFIAAFVANAILFASAGCTSNVPPISDPTLPTETVVMTADYPGFLTLEENVDEADVIITGTWLNSHDDVLYPDVLDEDDPAYNDPILNPHSGVDLSEDYLSSAGVPITVSSVQVDSVIKGTLEPGTTINVQQTGGTIDNVRYVEENTTLLKDVKSSEVLLFLKDWENGQFSLINPTVGVWKLSGSKVAPVSDNARSAFTIGNVSSVSTEVSRQEKGK